MAQKVLTIFAFLENRRSLVLERYMVPRSPYKKMVKLSLHFNNGKKCMSDIYLYNARLAKGSSKYIFRKCRQPPPLLFALVLLKLFNNKNTFQYIHWPYPVVSHVGGGGGVCTPPVGRPGGSAHPSLDADPPGWRPPWSCDLWCMLVSHPPPNKMTHRCKNITFSQLCGR